MRAVGYEQAGGPLVDITLPEPVAVARDLLVRVHAVSVNPVDTKVRKRGGAEAGQRHKVLGFDAAGVVEAVGPGVTGFAVGDAVFYAGALGRPGTNSELHLVDERIVGRKPASLSMAQAAALPLTAITAWEGLFDRLDVRRAVPGFGAVLVIGGAGGVASIAIQLARQLTGLVVIGTSSRPETAAWVKELGAHHVVDHSRPLAAEVAALGIGAPGFVFGTTQTDRHLAEIGTLIAPQGRFCVIDDPGPLEINLFKQKSVVSVWEFMFTRSMFETADMAEQGVLLNEVSRLVDAGTLRTTLGKVMGPISAANLTRTHALIESGTAVGKMVLEGWA